MAQSEILKRYIEAGIAFTEATRARAEEFVKDLARAGEVQWDQVQSQVDELLEWTKRNREEMRGIVREDVAAPLSQLGLAAKDHLEALGQTFKEGLAAMSPWRGGSQDEPGNADVSPDLAGGITAEGASVDGLTAGGYAAAPAKKAPAKKAAAKKVAAKKAAAAATDAAEPAVGATAPTKKAAAKRAPARRAPAKKAPAVTDAQADKAPAAAKKTAAKKTAAKKTAAKKTAAAKAPAATKAATSRTRKG